MATRTRCPPPRSFRRPKSTCSSNGFAAAHPGASKPRPASRPRPEKQFDLAARAQHWSFRPLAEVSPPEVANAGWIQTPVDRFILARLEAADLAPAPPADKRTLLRRVTFDLTGLPPTPAEIDAFLADDSPAAYETVVDRLLASPHYGERWARHWLDLVRYAETRGHEFDFEIPNAFRYRDYLIRAFNADIPYDRFVVEHVAGDLLDPPRRNPQEGFNESIIATGWYCFGEALHSPVDVRADEANRIDNQIDVFSKTFLGLTVSCARCHDHKFDAISTKDYYALAGYLQSSRYQQAYIDSPESLTQPIAQLGEITAERRRACAEFARAELAPRVAAMAETLLDGGGQIDKDAAGRREHVLHPWAILANGPAAGDEFSRRRIELAAELNAQRAAEAANQELVLFDFNATDFGAWTATGQAFGDRPGRPLEWAFAGPRGRLPGRLLTCGTAHSGLVSPKLQGVLRSPTFEITTPKIAYRVYGDGGRVRLVVDGLELIRNPIYGALEFAPGGHEPHWHEQDVSKWVGHRAYIELVDDGDGYLALEQVARSNGGAFQPSPNGLVVAMLDEAEITSPAVLAERYQATFARIFTDWLASPDAAPADAADRAEIVAWILEQQLLDPQGTKSAEVAFQNSLAALDARQRDVEATIAPPRTAPGLADGTAENEHVFIRGNHKTPGDEVPRRFLEAFGGTEHAPPQQGSGRLELARQMISPACPLVPRVIVNRLWHHHFGAGIVRSPDDFGAMGQPPTHPELLDYLAQDLVRHGWSLKYLHRLMVLSGTYQMSSHVDPEVDRADPQNKLWHRMAVRRLEAETIRDAVLAVSGRLDPTMYGPGVMPHLTDFMVGRGRPKDSGPLDGGGRRSIYLAVRRNFPDADVLGLRLSHALYDHRPPRHVERARTGVDDDEQPAGDRPGRALGRSGVGGRRPIARGPHPRDVRRRRSAASPTPANCNRPWRSSRGTIGSRGASWPTYC